MMDIFEAVKILNAVTEKHDGFEFVAQPIFSPHAQSHEVQCNLIFDDAPEALQVCKALESLLSYVYQNPPKKK